VEKRPNWREAEINLAMAHWKLKEYDAARTVLSQLLEREPDCIEAVRGLAAVALDRDYTEEALGYHQRLQEFGEKSPEILYNSGLLSYRLGRHEEAAALYRAALNEQPEFPEALLNLGHVLKALGRDDQARSYWTLAIEAKPELAVGYFHHS
jgi:tetratricopeptide (TPR) repeat protein